MPPELQYFDQPIAAQPVSATDQVNADMMQTSRVENIISQLNPENLLVDIEHRIRKMRKDTYTGQWVPLVKDQKPVSNLLVANTINYLSPYLTNNVTFSNYNEIEINRVMKIVIDDCIKDLLQNGEEYGIEGDYAEYNRITSIVCSTIYSSLKRALKGTEAHRFWKSVTISGDVDNMKDDGGGRKSFKDYFKIW